MSSMKAMRCRDQTRQICKRRHGELSSIPYRIREADSAFPELGIGREELAVLVLQPQ